MNDIPLEFHRSSNSNNNNNNNNNINNNNIIYEFLKQVALLPQQFTVKVVDCTDIRNLETNEAGTLGVG
jgi:hypothetical protein